MRVTILVCHLSGTGHLVRALALARAVQAAGGRVRVISGGRPLPHLGPPGVEVVQLPPLEVPDFDYAHPRIPGGAVAEPEYFAARRAALVAALDPAPDVLVTETYPFGRRSLAAEFEAAVARVPRVVCSVRDVPEPPSRPARLAEAAARLAPYRAVLVHGEAAVIGLDATWPLPPGGPPVHYTGYVGDPAPEAGGTPGGVLVSVGGGVLGRELLGVAAAAARGDARRWHLLVGGSDAAAVAAGLARPGLVVEPARADYRALLAGAAVSVSLAGYNTVMDLAACTTPAVLVPFSGAGQREQTLRAAALARFGGVTVLSQPDADSLRAAVAAAAAGRRAPWPLARDGAARAAARILAIARDEAA